MPGERPFVRMTPIRLAALVEVRKAKQFRVPIRVVHRHDVDLYFAELAGERDLCRRRQLVRREEEHLIAKESLADPAEDFRRDAFREVDSGDFASKIRRQRTYRERQVGRAIRLPGFQGLPFAKSPAYE